MKKTIVVTKEVEVGPGYVPIYLSHRMRAWTRNGWGGARGYPMYDSVEALLAQDYAPGAFSTDSPTRSVLYVPAGVSVDDALAALNALKPVADAKATAEVPL